MELSWYILIFLGAVGGTLAGLLGIGGGIVYVLILEYTLPYEGVLSPDLHRFVIVNSLACVFFASLSANIENIRCKDFYIKSVLWLGLPASVFTILTLKFIVEQSFFSRERYDIIIVTLLLYMVYKVFRSIEIIPKDISQVSKSKLSLTGLLGGVVASLSGFGGGVVMVPIMNGFYKIDIRIAKSISLGVISITALVALIYSFYTSSIAIVPKSAVGLIFPSVVLPISVGVVIASTLATRWSSRLSPKVISWVYVTFMLLFIAKKVVEMMI